MNKLFEMMSKGEMPDFLQVMAAISEISMMYPESENSAQDKPKAKKYCPIDSLSGPDSYCSHCD